MTTNTQDLYASETRIAMLQRRTARCRCKYCGGPLTVKRISFSDFEAARLEIYCDACGRIEYGVEPEIYHSAESFVDAVDFQYYPDFEDNALRRRMNIAKICDILAWGFRHTGLLTENGFTIPLAANAALDDTLLLTEDALKEALAKNFPERTTPYDQL